MSNPSLTYHSKASKFLRSWFINIARLKLAYRWTSGSLGTTFTSLAGFLLKHGATAAKGLEKPYDSKKFSQDHFLLQTQNPLFTQLLKTNPLAAVQSIVQVLHKFPELFDKNYQLLLFGVSQNYGYNKY